jgi:serine/threonine protein kinase
MMNQDTIMAGSAGADIGNYRLERGSGHDEFGPIYLARDASGAAFRLRVLAVRPQIAPGMADAYVARFQQQADHLALLRHPHILPLLDFGIFRGIPYLVWPLPPPRSLSKILDESGPLDVRTAAHYVEQIADALEYAHDHETLHRNLSTDCVFPHQDGQVVVADFGVRRIFELTASEADVHAAIGASDACAPEQVLSGRVYLYTDVYALGALAYRLLAGAPVFSGGTRDDIAQQHVYAQVPLLSTRRPDLPGRVDAVLARALAKNPDQRYPRAGALARAFSQAGAGAGRPTDGPLPAATLPKAPSLPNPPEVAVIPADGNATRAAAWPSPSASATVNERRPLLDAPRSERAASRTMGRIAVTVALLFVLVTGGVFILGGRPGGGVAGMHASATIAFLDASAGPPGVTDAIQLVAHGLVTPASGYHYYAWMVNSKTESVVPLGVLTADGASYNVNGQGGSSAAGSGVNLLGVGDRVEVTLEQGSVIAPVGHVVLSGTFPPMAFVHIKHLLVSFPTTPGNIGLLVGVLNEAQKLNAQAALLQNAAAGNDVVAVRCAAQSLLDIIEGKEGAHYQQLGAACAAKGVSIQGDGFGLLGPASGGGTYSLADASYLDNALAHASLAATRSDATDTIRTHARHVEIALANIKGWVTTVQADALKLLQSPSNGALIGEIVTLSDHAYTGVVTGGDQLPQPVVGQAGAQTAYEHGQFMAMLSLSS